MQRKSGDFYLLHRATAMTVTLYVYKRIYLRAENSLMNHPITLFSASPDVERSRSSLL